MIDLSTIPQEIGQGLTLIAEEFGGWRELSKFLKLETLQTLVTFPGPVRLVKPWQMEIDLTEYDFIPNSQYSVFNSRWQWLYTCVLSKRRLFRSIEGPNPNLFGYDVRDLAATMLVPHSDTLYLSFPSVTGRRVVLLWVANELTPLQLNQWIQEILRNYENVRYINRTDYVSLRERYPNRRVRVMFLSAGRRSNTTPEVIRHSERSKVMEDDFGRSGFVSVAQSGWYLFDELTGQNLDSVQAVDLKNLSGVGLDRFERVQKGLYFAYGPNSVQSTVNLTDMFSFDSSIDNFGEPIQIEADLDEA